MYMNTYSNNQESVDAEEQNRMYEDWNPTGVHVPEFDEARPSRQLEQQPWRQEDEQPHRHRHRPPIRSHSSLTLCVFYCP